MAPGPGGSLWGEPPPGTFKSERILLSRMRYIDQGLDLYIYMTPCGMGALVGDFGRKARVSTFCAKPLFS